MKSKKNKSQELQNQLEKRLEENGALLPSENAIYQALIYINGGESNPLDQTINYTSVLRSLPKVPKDKTIIKVHVRTKNGRGQCYFGFHGGPGESPDGHFFHPIENYEGSVELEIERPIEWAYISKSNDFPKE